MWISKKKLDSLRFELETEKDKADYWLSKFEDVKSRISFYRMRSLEKEMEEAKTIVVKQKEEIDKVKKELEYYKQLYLDEQHKCLELAEMVRKMDGD